MKFLLMALTVLLVGHGALAGDGTKGTDPDVLVGLAIKQSLTGDSLVQYHKRVAEIADIFANHNMNKKIGRFVLQADPNRFLPKPEADTTSARNIYSAMLTRGLKDEVSKAEFKIETECPDEMGILRPASTRSAPGSDICIDPERLGLLELALKPRLGEEANLLFGVAMHEFARHYGFDDSHEFLLAMAREDGNDRQTIVYSDCPENAIFCRLPGYYSWAYDVSKSPTFKIKTDMTASNLLNPSQYAKPLSSKNAKKCAMKEEAWTRSGVESQNNIIFRPTLDPSGKASWFVFDVRQFIQNPDSPTTLEVANKMDMEEFLYVARGQSTWPCAGNLEMTFFDDAGGVFYNVREADPNVLVTFRPWHRPTEPLP